MADKKVHLGRNVKRICEMMGVKQDALAYDLDMSQSTISAMEQREEIDAELLDRVAKVLGVPADAIRNFNEEATIYNIQNNSDTSSHNQIVNYQFNPIDKWLAAMEENKALYERLLQSEREKVTMLQELLEKKG